METIRVIALVCVALSALALSPAAVSEAESATTTIVVIRHAEKSSDGANPALSPQGERRAQALVGMLENAGVTAIYSSQYRRTWETVEPLSGRIGVAVTIEEITSENLARYPEQLAKRVLEQNAGGTVVIVNHSNTVPEIVTALGGGPVPPMSEAEYDHVFIVVRDGAKTRGISAGYPAAIP